MIPHQAYDTDPWGALRAWTPVVSVHCQTATRLPLSKTSVFKARVTGHSALVKVDVRPGQSCEWGLSASSRCNRFSDSWSGMAPCVNRSLTHEWITPPPYRVIPRGMECIYTESAFMLLLLSPSLLLWLVLNVHRSWGSLLVLQVT
jgi:hypothetical protein